MALSDAQILEIKQRYNIDDSSGDSLKVYHYNNETYNNDHWDYDYIIGNSHLVKEVQQPLWSSVYYNQIVTGNVSSLIDSDNVWLEWTGE